MMALVDVVDNVDLRTITTPTMILYSEQDEVISVDRIKEKYPHFGSLNKRLLAIETAESEGNHVIAGDIVAPTKTEVVAKEIVAFLRDVGIATASAGV
jgi:esterase/lipase